MKGILRIILLSAYCSSSHQASILHQQRFLGDHIHRALISDYGVNRAPSMFEKMGVLLDKIDAVAKFVRDYNAIPKIGSCLQFIMPRFKTGREFLMHYNQVKAKNEGRFPSLQKATTTSAKVIIQPIVSKRLEYIFVYPSKELISKSPQFKLLLGLTQKSLPYYDITCYNCRNRKESWKRYSYFQNRRKRWPKTNSPRPVVPHDHELHLIDFPTPPPTTKEIPTLSFRDILPGPNQLPFYANMFLDVFDTHFESWNAKIRWFIHAIKQKLSKNDKKKATPQKNRSSSSSVDDSSDYTSTSMESYSSSNSSNGASGEYYESREESSSSSGSTDEDSRSDRRSYSSSSSGESRSSRVNVRYKHPGTGKEEEYEYYSESSEDRTNTDDEVTKEKIRRKGDPNNPNDETISDDEATKEKIHKTSDQNISIDETISDDEATKKKIHKTSDQNISIDETISDDEATKEKTHKTSDQNISIDETVSYDEATKEKIHKKSNQNISIDETISDDEVTKGKIHKTSDQTISDERASLRRTTRRKIFKMSPPTVFTFLKKLSTKKYLKYEESNNKQKSIT